MGEKWETYCLYEEVAHEIIWSHEHLSSVKDKFYKESFMKFLIILMTFFCVSVFAWDEKCDRFDYFCQDRQKGQNRWERNVVRFGADNKDGEGGKKSEKKRSYNSERKRIIRSQIESHRRDMRYIQNTVIPQQRRNGDRKGVEKSQEGIRHARQQISNLQGRLEALSRSQ